MEKYMTEVKKNSGSFLLIFWRSGCRIISITPFVKIYIPPDYNYNYN
jgi:hypothetical protein